MRRWINNLIWPLALVLVLAYAFVSANVPDSSTSTTEESGGTDHTASSAYTSMGAVWGTVSQWFNRNKPKPVVVLRGREKLPNDCAMTFDVVEGVVRLTDHLGRSVSVPAGQTDTKYPPNFKPYLVEPKGDKAVWAPDFNCGRSHKL